MYVLYSCDEWKSRSSLYTIGIYSNYKSLLKRIMYEQSLDNMELSKQFKLEYENDNGYFISDLINEYLDYGYVEWYPLDREED